MSSSDEEKNAAPQEPNEKKNDKEKKKKPKGPIRFEAIVPAFVVIGLIAAYGHFFFNGHFKKFLELAGSYGYGAEINIDELELSLIETRLDIWGVQVTDIDHPERNLIEIEGLHFALNGDALLRAKFVIPNASIENILIHSERDKPGKIYRSRKETESKVGEAGKKVLSNAKTELAGNIFGDAAALLDGQDPTQKLNEVKGNLQTKKKIAEIQSRLDEKKKFWNQRLKELPNEKTLNSHIKTIKGLKFDIKKPKEFANSVKKGSETIKAANRDVKSIQEDSKKFQNDLNAFKGIEKELAAAKANDLKSLQQRVSLPQLDAKKIALLLFGDEAREYIAKFEKYSAMAKEYMPEDDGEGGEAESSSISPKERSLGKTYEFVTKKSYPTFWLQKAMISSEADGSELSGDLEGTLLDFTSNAAHLGKPAKVLVKGSFPAKKVMGLDATVTLNQHEESRSQLLDAKIASFPIGRKDFSNSDDLKFGFSEASGRTVITGKLVDKDLKLNVDSVLSQIKYQVSAKSTGLNQALKQVARDVPKITINTLATGNWRSPAIKVSTNLAGEIQKSLGRQLNQKIKETEAKIKSLLNKEIDGKKNQLMAEVNGFKNKYNKELTKLKGKADKIKKNAQAELDKKKKSGKTKKVEQKAKKEIKKLFKKLKF